MEINSPYKLWLSIGGLSLIALTCVVLWLKAPPEITTEPPTTPVVINHVTNPTADTVDDTLAVVDPVAVVIPKVPPVDFPQGSIGHTCAVNDFPPYHWYVDLDYETSRSLDNHPFYDSNGDQRVLKGECHSVLERHLYSLNPYYWGAQDEKRPVNRAFDFIVIDNPLTFERIFADPAGDFARVQEAFTKPECLLAHNAESNWELNEICHADAILNYAFITRFCYNDSYHGYDNWVTERPSQHYLEENNPTPAQDRHMWIQSLEDRWIREKCKTLDSNLNLHAKQHTELRQQIQKLQPRLYNRVSLSKLIELAARLGDDAAALTQPAMHVAYHRSLQSDEGYKYGPFAGWLTNKYELFTIKDPPSVDRIGQALSLFAKNLVGKKGRRVIIDHEALVQHLCTPPYYDPDNEYPNPPSCRTVVIKLRQQALHHTTLNLIATFEDVAMRLDVYE